ncbi:MAG: translocation/assembly module TamB domain-containing protein [Xanthomonadales bacterium]|nr:translocation/assembly module TamB domain-containing protein [Xanthomonadales bacterium]
MRRHGSSARLAPARGAALPRALLWAGIVLGVLVLAIALFVAWLIGSQAGARFALARAVGATDGRLAVERIEGRLAGPLTLTGVRWKDAEAGVDAKVARVALDLAPSELLARRVHVTALDVDGVDVALSTVPPRPEEPAGEFSLSAPIDIVLDRLALSGARITKDGEPVFALDRLDLGGAWTRAGAVVKTLSMTAPDGEVQLAGTVAAAAGYPGNGEVSFRWKVADADYAGTLKASGDGTAARLDLALVEPMAATVAATLGETAAWPWTLAVSVLRFDPAVLLGESNYQSLALDLQGSGDKDQGTLGGTVELDDHRVLLDPLRYTLADQVLKIESLVLKAPDGAPGQLAASGEVRLAAEPIDATLALEWSDVTLPADLAGQELASHGRLQAAGSADKFHAEGALAIGPPGELADLALNLDGTRELITLHQLALKQPRGGLDASGTLTLQPAIGWDITATADRLDPGAFAADWPGAIDFDLASQGTLTDAGPNATVKLDRLGGTLRKRPLAGHVDLAIQPDYIVDGTLDLAAGGSRVQASGRGGNQTDATLTLAINSLGDWLPDAGGRLDGSFRIGGKWPALGVKGSAHGTKIAMSGTHVAALDIQADIADVSAPQGSLDVKASDLVAGALVFDTLTLDAGGNRARHTLELAASGSPLGTRLALSGSMADNGTWKGTLSTLDATIKDAPPLALRQPAALAWDGSTFTADEICLAGRDPTLCVAGSGGADGALDARYRIEDLPLALIMRLAAPDAPLAVDGMLAGHGEIHRSAKGVLDGSATLQSARGSVAYPDRADRPLLTWSDFGIDATLAADSIRATVGAALDHDGTLDGELTLAGPAGTAQTLSGHLALDLKSLAFIEIVTAEVANTKGRLSADYRIGGTTAAPELAGALTLSGFAAEVPAAGLKLHDGNVSLRAADASRFVLEGTIASGDGQLAISGSGGLDKDAPLEVSIKGEKFLAADIPAAHVVVSPDLTVQRSTENLTVTGSVTIPSTRVDLARLPGGGVAKTSPDVVIVDAEQPEPGQPLPVVVSVDVHVGDDVKLAGFGFDGSLKGNLHIEQRPGRSPTGTGTLNAGGTYKAYGQDLTIESGRVLFAGTALDNPGLDIRAVRTIQGASRGVLDDSVTAGLQVRGTAQVPVLTVFSRPSMPQSEALSYLITGKPLSGLKSGEGDMLGSAARALGSAGGDLLAKKIGARMGIEAGVSDNLALGGAAFTVGKYLSPKLYLSYGVGLFTPGEVVTLKYIINPRWNFEAENATTGNRAGINYRIER